MRKETATMSTRHMHRRNFARDETDALTSAGGGIWAAGDNM